MTRIETLLSQFFNPKDGSKQQPGQPGIHLTVPIDRTVEVDAAAEIAQVLAHWIRIDLTFAVLWFSTYDLGLVILTPAELLLHHLSSPIALP